MTNDDKILLLKTKVADKKALIAKAQKFSPITNLSLTLWGQNYNINTLDKDTLLFLAASLKAIQNTTDMNIKLCGFNLNDWIIDLQARYDILNIKEEEKRLKALEEQLHELLSTDKKVELKLEDLANSI
jgi:hypothetical protein